MGNAANFFIVPRTCTHVVEGSQERISSPLRDYRDRVAYVLLGDPGAGKTKAFEREAEESGSEYIKARDFATFDPKEEYRDKTLFIDGLDEMRAGAGDSRTPLDHIRRHLEKLERPRFRLSCREADWLGASDSEALKRVSQDGTVVALHLDPLTDDDIVEILRHEATEIDPDAFVSKANEHRLAELLRNPQTLKLLIEAVGGNEWPRSRKETYEMACHQLVRDPNLEHRQAKRDTPIPDDTLLDAAGYLCAIQLLSGLAGYALDDDAIDLQHVGLQGFANPANLPLMRTLKTNLFQGDGEEQRIPVHRSVAEYLGARYIAALVETRGLPFGRVLALMTGQDGGVVADLRGLSAWLSVHCGSGRVALIERDPLGVVLYGDVRHFPTADKQLILAAMEDKARDFPWFRSEDWSPEPFGALGTTDMAPVFSENLASPSRDDASQALLDCVLDAIRFGEYMPMLANSLRTIVQDASYRPAIRRDALQALMHVTQNDNSHLLRLAEDIRTGVVEDRDDEMLGVLLSKLYPHFISPVQIFDYLHSPKDRNLIGGYFMFWIHDLPAKATKDDLPTLLDQLAQRRIALEDTLYEHQINRMAGNLLARGLDAHGDAITDERLHDWLGVGLDKYAHPRLEKEHAESVARWFVDRPDRYKAILAHSAALCAEHKNMRFCMHRCTARLYDATPPSDIVSWYLEMATAERQSGLAGYFFDQAAFQLKQQGGKHDLTLQSLEFLESWTSKHPAFQKWLEPFITCPVGDWQQEHAIADRKWKAESQKRKSEWVSYFRKHIAQIREGGAPPKVLHDLALVYDKLLIGVEGKTPRERLDDFLDGDTELIEAAYAGFRHALARNDLPTVTEIVDLEVKGRMHFIRRPCLVGMDEWYQTDPSSALRLDDAVLMRLLAFRLTHHIGDDPPWFIALLRERAALVAEVLIRYALAMARAGKEHIAGLYSLAHDDAYAGVARIALPALLKGFPLRARKNQLGNALDPLLKGALRYLDKKVLGAIIERKLGQSSMDPAQRVYWLGCGLVIAPKAYEAALAGHIGRSGVRKRYLANFLYSRGLRQLPDAALPETALARLIEMLAPDCSPERPTGEFRVTQAMNTADLMRSLIDTLGGRSSETATQELERLLTVSAFSQWHNSLRGALHSQRIARRKASFRPLGAEEVSRTLANLQPASAADLAALALDYLRDIARKIRDGSTNDYRQYWSYDESNRQLANPKPENDCRDALLSDLKERFDKLGIDAQKEGYYAEDKRADIRVSFDGTSGFNIPIEIKKDNHDNLWTGIREQLVAQYVRDPGTDGYGIYLVFWFGGKGMRPPPDGKKPRSAEELEDRLRGTLEPEEKHSILVCVIDCALS
ncbi:MAG: hypothetical protein HY525_08945 [Betaproteobacteria bacterium]|nr:hypothetical protein [Betaproteobacteria bacterium]